MRYKDWVFRKASYCVYDSDIDTGTTYYICYGIKFKYRFDQVPGVGKYRCCPRSYFRRPFTTNERRWSFACDTRKFIRGRRRYNLLSSSYDDLEIADNRIRSWKRTKKLRQWM